MFSGSDIVSKLWDFIAFSNLLSTYVMWCDIFPYIYYLSVWNISFFKIVLRGWFLKQFLDPLGTSVSRPLISHLSLSFVLSSYYLGVGMPVRNHQFSVVARPDQTRSKNKHISALSPHNHGTRWDQQGTFIPVKVYCSMCFLLISSKLESYPGLCLGQSLTQSVCPQFFTKRKGKHPCQLSVWQCRD